MEHRKALTMIEMLVVIGIIALLLGIMIPSLQMVKRMAKRTQQNSQFTAIELGLSAFQNENGYLPPSDWEQPAPNLGYCGAQKLSEALLGWDLMGFHPDSMFNANGMADDGTTYIYADTEENLMDRRGVYVELQTARPFRLGPLPSGGQGDYLFRNPENFGLAPATFVLCDVFPARKVTFFRPDGTSVTRNAGKPILYYKANPARRSMADTATRNRIYDVRDNLAIIHLVKDYDRNRGNEKVHPLGDPLGTFGFFYDYISDPSVTHRRWPYNADSYILISAGADGEYGTDDDICNFEE